MSWTKVERTTGTWTKIARTVGSWTGIGREKSEDTSVADQYVTYLGRMYYGGGHGNGDDTNTNNWTKS